MPRFSLPRSPSFFRRKRSSIDDNALSSSNTIDTNTAAAYPINTTDSTDSTDSTAPSSSQVTDGPRSTPDSRNPSDLSLALPTPRQAAASSKRSASLTRLRDKFLERGAEVPESVQEVRESVLLDWEPPQHHSPNTNSEPVSSRRSGSETLAVGRSPVGESVLQEEEEEGGKQSRVTKLKLDDCGLEHTAPACPPAVVVEGPTPIGEGGKEISLITQDQLLADDTPVNSASVSPLTHPAEIPIRPAHDANANIVHTLVEAPSRHQASNSIPSFSSALPTSAVIDYFTPGLPNMAQMLHRKIWVRRPGASATLVQIRGDDLVDDVREMILKKYKNSLGGTFDAPDMTLRIIQRAEQGQQQHERILGPEEDICHTIDMCYPGGQMVEEALVIDVPMRERRTPRPSPRAYNSTSYQALDEYRPLENGTDYFPPMPPVAPQSMPQTTNSHDGRAAPHLSLAGAGPFPLEHHQRSMSVLNTGQIAPLPSPGGTMRQRGHRDHRPKFQRQHTSSPTIVQHPSSHPPGVNLGVIPVGATAAPPNPNPKPQHALMHRSSIWPRTDSMTSDAHHATSNGVLAPPGAQQTSQPPSPSAQESKGLAPLQGGSTPPTPPSSTAPNGAPAGGGSGGPPTLRPGRPKRTRKSTPDKPTSTSTSTSRPRHPDPLKPSPTTTTTTTTTAPKPNAAPAPPPSISSVLDGSVPPINVLIVEDNIINLRILEGLMKRLRVRWQTAMNGQIAVDKWRAGGFHLVLMDIQMPVMNGLAATKEIRRLERVNGIGVFSEVVSPEEDGEGEEGEGKVPKKMGDVEVEDTEGEQNGSLATAASKRGSKSPDDRLAVSSALFKSPIIIVALTASSLQSDRHEALAAGCNDFLTKPVDFVWLERKVKEWGCMQALIDFEGWRAWKVLVAREEEGKTDEQREQERLRAEKEKRRMEKMAVLQEKARVKKEEEEREKERERERRRSKRVSSNGVEGGEGEN
ncbi:Two-component response regulator SSK1p [Friedmanniomyces endolithicus]|nr:Two-component response regulator SSK1p [Friedmanniomyces endolithicus]KAK0837692.1 Two-component response regulator SSK1p [Friedmanniomyces endolithicus]